MLKIMQSVVWAIDLAHPNILSWPPLGVHGQSYRCTRDFTMEGVHVVGGWARRSWSKMWN